MLIFFPKSSWSQMAPRICFKLFFHLLLKFNLFEDIIIFLFTSGFITYYAMSYQIIQQDMTVHRQSRWLYFKIFTKGIGWWVCILEASMLPEWKLPKPLPSHQGDLEGPRGGCQPWEASQTPPRSSERPGRPSRWVPALERFPDPSQAIREAWRAFEVGANHGVFPRPLSVYQGDVEGPRGGCQSRRAFQTPPRPSRRPGDPRGGCQPWRPSQTPLTPSRRSWWPSRWVPALASFPNPSQAIRETWEGRSRWVPALRRANLPFQF